MIDQFAQYGVLFFGPAAIWVVGWKGKRRRWGYILGLASQPFWFITLYHNEQWPIFIVAFIYTYSWCSVIWNHWLRDIKKGAK